MQRNMLGKGLGGHNKTLTKEKKGLRGAGDKMVTDFYSKDDEL